MLISKVELNGLPICWLFATSAAASIYFFRWGSNLQPGPCGIFPFHILP